MLHAILLLKNSDVKRKMESLSHLSEEKDRMVESQGLKTTVLVSRSSMRSRVSAPAASCMRHMHKRIISGVAPSRCCGFVAVWLDLSRKIHQFS